MFGRVVELSIAIVRNTESVFDGMAMGVQLGSKDGEAERHCEYGFRKILDCHRKLDGVHGPCVMSAPVLFARIGIPSVPTIWRRRVGIYESTPKHVSSYEGQHRDNLKCKDKY
jgi:hypothetical protein